MSCSLNDDLITSFLLCLIHATVCNLDHGFIFVSVRTVLRDPEACRETHVGTGNNRDGFILDTPPQSFCYRRGTFARGFWEHQGEFLTAEPSDKIAWTQNPSRQDCKCLEHFVSGPVTILVVDLLEVIEINRNE